MFPQTELDNYKLQVELLQEKLQRSEISRQQLEHNLEKILLKRDEHDKVVRLKSKQKYQKFLEEQQRRNERNKQLVQMLERIEQQTSSLNARSERLKMMKLQYEMYFAKIVHSQTRRCIQSSAAGTATVPIMATTTLPRPVGQTMMIPTTSMDGFSYTNVYSEPPLVGNSYPSFPDSAMNRDHFLYGPPREPTIVDLPMSDYELHSERSDYLEMRKPEPFQLRQQRYEPNMTIGDLEERKTQFNNSMPVSKEQIFYNNAPGLKENQTFSPTTSLLDKNKKILDLDLPTTISSSSAALTFDSIPNTNMVSNTTSNSIKSDDNRNILADSNNHNLELQKVYEISPKSEQHLKNAHEDRPNTESSISELTPNLGKDIQHNYENVVQKIETRQHPQMHMPTPQMQRPAPQEVNIHPVSSYEIQPEQQRVKLSEVKGDEMEIKHLPPTTRENAPVPPSVAPVSLENIENAIYGELVNPLEETNQTQEKPRVGPALLENLVTQPPESVETKVASVEPTKVETQQYVTGANASSYNNETPAENTQLSVNNQNYEQAYDYNTPATNSNVDDGQNNSNVDYTGYEMNSKTLDNNQQQQQYDYTNYDPSQYSYPGYIYDETTGEYKPDPNAPAEQYATDQQYAQGYDQQYQQEAYDYNQAYEQQDQQSVALDSAAYADYDTKQQSEQPTTFAETGNIEATSQKQEQQLERQEPITEQNKDVPETQASVDVSETPAKNTKPASILATTEKNDQQKRKKRVNFVESSETDNSSVDKGPAQTTVKPPTTGNESDFDFSSGSEAAAKSA